MIRCSCVILWGLLLGWSAACSNGPTSGPGAPDTELVEWQRGFAIRSLHRDDLAAYLWFYEWHMFDAIKKGQHTGGSYDWPRTVDGEGARGRIDAGENGLVLDLERAPGGAELKLTVTNTSDHDWPELASIIPCFSPGMKEGKAPRTPQFSNENTYFLGPEGLVKLHKREIHYNAKLRPKVDAEAKDGRYAWTSKWPKAEPNAVRGILVRVSNDGKWVAGIGWEDFLSSQGHNPWRCMHLSIRVGPLKRGESRTIRGRAYLFQGTKEECLARFRRDVP